MNEWKPNNSCIATAVLTRGCVRIGRSFIPLLIELPVLPLCTHRHRLQRMTWFSCPAWKEWRASVTEKIEKTTRNKIFEPVDRETKVSAATIPRNVCVSLALFAERLYKQAWMDLCMLIASFVTPTSLSRPRSLQVSLRGPAKQWAGFLLGPSRGKRTINLQLFSAKK